MTAFFDIQPGALTDYQEAILAPAKATISRKMAEVIDRDAALPVPDVSTIKADGATNLVEAVMGGEFRVCNPEYEENSTYIGDLYNTQRQETGARSFNHNEF